MNVTLPAQVMTPRMRTGSACSALSSGKARMAAAVVNGGGNVAPMDGTGGGGFGAAAAVPSGDVAPPAAARPQSATTAIAEPSTPNCHGDRSPIRRALRRG